MSVGFGERGAGSGSGSGSGSGFGKRYVCIHGHFYQPPRENPWLEAVEVQDSAAPYHDWNERVSAECYEPNAFARILDGRGLIARISNNYERISWNFGPTLLAWMQQKTPKLYQAILAADEVSQRRFSGHGSAMAQAYNHAILPLCNRRDKRTQIVWGLRDFKTRFGRLPEGMWLPETAVDLESLDIMAEFGVRFTVLAPYQARAIRRLKDPPGEWNDMRGGRIDPKRAYQINLPSGRQMALFFYDGPVARAVAFERLLDRGEDLIARLVSTFAPDRDEAQLVHIATDGETYGHHHKYGEMALAYALDQFDHQRSDVVLTNYGEFLARHPPNYEVAIFENTSWSCAHGIERWRSDCGCNTGSRPGENQRWRAPLRAAFDFLRDAAAALYEEQAAPLLRDPWAARDDYIDVILDRSSRSRARFLQSHATQATLDAGAQIRVWKLLELQRHAQLMYTSCGWFFSDLGGPEPMQDIQYAGRALQLAGELGAPALEAQFLQRLELARGNTPEMPTGGAVYAVAVQRARADLCHVAAHHAISTLCRGSDGGGTSHLYCYTIEQEAQRQSHAGRLRLGVGRVRIRSAITLEEAALCYGALHFGDHNVTAGVLPVSASDDGISAYQNIANELSSPFSRGDAPEILRALDRLFAARTYSLKHLFRDEQRAIVGLILDKTLRSVAAAFAHLYENHAPLMRFLADIGVPQPAPLLSAADFELHSSLRTALTASPFDRLLIARLVEEAGRSGVAIDYEPLRFSLGSTIERLLGALEREPIERRLLEELLSAVELAAAPPFQVNLWKVQNAYAELTGSVYPLQRARAASDADASEWVRLFTQLGERLQVRVPGST